MVLGRYKGGEVNSKLAKIGRRVGEAGVVGEGGWNNRGRWVEGGEVSRMAGKAG